MRRPKLDHTTVMLYGLEVVSRTVRCEKVHFLDYSLVVGNAHVKFVVTNRIAEVEQRRVVRHWG